MAEAKKLRYVGPFRAVDVPALGTTVRRNHQIEVEDKAVAADLLKQADWEEVGAKAAAKKDDDKNEVAPPAEEVKG